MIGYIYLTTNTKTGLIYVGQKRSTTFLGDKYLGSGKLLVQAVKEFGRESFVVQLIEEIEDDSKLAEREVYWIDHYCSTDRSIGYNICRNGHVARLVGEQNPFYGKHHSAETRAKLVEAQRLRTYYPKRSEESKKRMSEKMKGRIITWGDKLSANAKINPNYGMRGKHLSREAVAKIAQTKRLRSQDPAVHAEASSRALKNWQDPEYRRKHVEGMRGRGKKRQITAYKDCPICSRKIYASNLSRHVIACQRDHIVSSAK